MTYDFFYLVLVVKISFTVKAEFFVQHLGLPQFLVGFVLLDLWFSVWCFVDHGLSVCTFSFWPLHSLSFFDLRPLIIPSVYSNFFSILKRKTVIEKELINMFTYCYNDRTKVQNTTSKIHDHCI